jgi:bile acid:Na+ symporter, BASS family
MTITSVILVAANVSLAMTMLCAGMGGLSGNTTYLIRRRGLFLRSLLSMSVLQPLFALWLCFAYDLRPAAMLALLAMAVSPMPPILPTGVLKVRGNRAFEVSLSYFTGILSVALVPASLWLFGRVLAVPLHVDLVVVIRFVTTSILLPLGVGFGLRRLSAETSARAVTPLTIGALGILVLVLLALVVESWPAFRLLGGGQTAIAIALMTVVGLVVGHVCGGPARKDRRVLAMSTALRHPALAIAIGASAFPNERIGGVVIVLSVLFGCVATAPYISLSRFTLPRP